MSRTFRLIPFSTPYLTPGPGAGVSATVPLTSAVK